MLLERDQLESMKMHELKGLAAEIGAEPSQPSETKESLINRLMLEAAKQPNPKEETLDEEQQKEPVNAPSCSMDEVKRACSAYILRGMKLYHDQKHNSWLMRVQLKSAMVRDSLTGERKMIERWRDDSGTLAQPLEVIKRCGHILMQNAPVPEQTQPKRSIADSYEAVA